MKKIDEIMKMDDVIEAYKALGLPLAKKTEADFDFLAQVSDGIQLIEQSWDAISGDRIRIIFNNGYQLSVIRGPFTYGGREGLFEIAPMEPKGGWAPYLFLKYDRRDDVLGYLSAECVRYYIEKIGRLSVGALRGIKRRSVKKNRLLRKRYGF